ncbi:thiamine phosphate phosphatase-like protein [Euphorbia lathyris]|uniref:thiamine phosphate phosphatase-like protein n=1 Tax=Euphorbia lathyris TaxID=212925 RepID=UPI00331418E0
MANLKKSILGRESVQVASFGIRRLLHCLAGGRQSNATLEMAGTVVVFDFDRTLIDDDTDRWVVTRMGLTSLFNQLRPTLPWNSLMDRMMKELHSRGKTADDIAQCLNQMPLHPRVTEAIKSIHALGCDLRIVSDANQFFIEKILGHHGLLGCFSQIITNPTSIDDEGRVRISPYHDLSSSPHDCRLCPSNLCKGTVIDQILVSTTQNEKKRFIYLGDGRNDFCPSLKLGEGDYVMPRKGYPLWDQLCSKPTLVKAKIHEWSNGKELADILLRILNAISAEESINSSNRNHLNSS